MSAPDAITAAANPEASRRGMRPLLKAVLALLVAGSTLASAQLYAGAWSRGAALGADGWTTASDTCGTLTVKVMTYNVLHFEAGASSREYGDWQQRKLQVAQVIEGYAADVVAVQEVRTVGVEGSPGWRCQATELAQLLPAYTFVRNTAMEFEEGSTEGLAVFVRHGLRIVHHNVTRLGASGADLNERILQHTVIHTAARDGCGLDLFHTHLSYHRDTQLHNIAAVMRAVQQTARAGALQVVLGDLNTHRDFPLVAQLLRGERRLGDALPPVGWTPFTDVWLALHPEPADHFTFRWNAALPELGD